MVAPVSPHLRRGDAGSDGGRALSALPLLPLQPVLAHVVSKIAARYPEIFDRLGPHQNTLFLIDPVDLPFALLLRPQPRALLLKAVPRADAPACGATISGKFFQLLRLIDADEDGDAMFFSRELTITGNVEAVVTLRNALDDVEGSVAESVAGLFGPPGRLALDVLRRVGGWRNEPGKDRR